MPPSSLSLATPRGGRPPVARQSRFHGGKLDKNRAPRALHMGNAEMENNE